MGKIQEVGLLTGQIFGLPKPEQSDFSSRYTVSAINSPLSRIHVI